MKPYQEDAFNLALNAVDTLMSRLYHVRGCFQDEARRVTENGQGVWHHIPKAQTLLEEIKREIEAARVSAEKAP
jgi:hypothetical protein